MQVKEATVRIRHGITDWFQIGKWVHQGCILSPHLFNLYAEFSSVQSLSCVQLFATPWIAARQASLSITNSKSLPKPMPIESVMPSSHHPVIPFSSCPQSFQALGSFPMSQLCMRWPKYWSFSLSISPSNPLWDGLVVSSCSARDSQESSPTPQFKSINSLALSFLHCSTLTSIHDHWKTHSLD